MSSFGGTAILAVQGVLGVAYAVVLWKAALRTKWATIAGNLRGAWTRAWRTDRSDAGKALRQKMDETRASNIRGISWMLVCISFPVYFLGSVGLFLTGDAGFNMTSIPVIQAGFVIVFVLYFCPRAVNAKTLLILGWTPFLIAVGNIAPGISSPDQLALASRTSSLIITMGNCGLLHHRTNLAQHCLYMLVASARFFLSPVHSKDWRSHVRAELTWAAWSCLCVAMMQRLVEAQHRSSIETKRLEEQRLANNKLLGVFYEVVLEVDHELTIVSSEPDLGLFLPHRAGNPIPPLLGSNFAELLPDEQDRQLLLQSTHRPLVEDNSVSVLHLRMGHGTNDSLRVELFSLLYQSFTGQRRHLLGVREYGDEAAASSGQAGLVLQVDLLDRDLAITEVSPGLQRELGSAALGSSLYRFVDDRPEFEDRFQVAINTMLCNEGPESGASFRTALRPQGRRVRLLADCSITLDEAPGHGRTAQLSFANLALVHMRSRSSRSARVGRTGSTRSNSSAGSSSSGELRGTPGQLRSQPLGSVLRPTRLGAWLSL